mmetsp:Transcript_20650/g.37350  ORF Transcript_20650/g.37350 Transcript_20650/m.37350 type:complete len:83 (-) Transcript_20650:215-463(-)
MRVNETKPAAIAYMTLTTSKGTPSKPTSRSPFFDVPGSKWCQFAVLVEQMGVRQLHGRIRATGVDLNKVIWFSTTHVSKCII